MAREHGFKFTIKGEVFVRQASNSGADIVAAYQGAVEASRKISEALVDIPVTFTISEPVGASRLVAEVEVHETQPDDDAIDPPVEDGPTPALDLSSRRRSNANKKRGEPPVAVE